MGAEKRKGKAGEEESERNTRSQKEGRAEGGGGRERRRAGGREEGGGMEGERNRGKVKGRAANRPRLTPWTISVNLGIDQARCAHQPGSVPAGRGVHDDAPMPSFIYYPPPPPWSAYLQLKVHMQLLTSMRRANSCRAHAVKIA